MHNGKVNKTRYDELGKSMKQTSSTVKKKKPKGKPSRKAIHYNKEKFQIQNKTFVPRLYNSRR